MISVRFDDRFKEAERERKKHTDMAVVEDSLREDKAVDVDSPNTEDNRTFRKKERIKTRAGQE